MSDPLELGQAQTAAFQVLGWTRATNCI